MTPAPAPELAAPAALQAQATARLLHERVAPLDAGALDLLFREARSHNGWLDRPVARETLEQLYDLVKLGPTSNNCSPARFIFLTTASARERLRPALTPGNVAKAMAAPVIVIIGYDLAFYDLLPRLFPHRDTRPNFVNNPEHAADTAFRNGTLQGAYLMLAARALGLDCGPMSGFDRAQVEREFFAGTRVRVNFLCALGHGDTRALFQRHPRLTLQEACQFL